MLLLLLCFQWALTYCDFLCRKEDGPQKKNCVKTSSTQGFKGIPCWKSTREKYPHQFHTYMSLSLGVHSLEIQSMAQVNHEWLILHWCEIYRSGDLNVVAAAALLVMVVCVFWLAKPSKINSILSNAWHTSTKTKEKEMYRNQFDEWSKCRQFIWMNAEWTIFNLQAKPEWRIIPIYLSMWQKSKRNQPPTTNEFDRLSFFAFYLYFALWVVQKFVRYIWETETLHRRHRATKSISVAFTQVVNGRT